jgi:DNA processing protein
VDYTTPKLDLNLLIPIFKCSLNESTNLFNSSQQQITEIIEKSFTKDSTHSRKVKKSKQIFLDQDYIASLESQATTELQLCNKHNINYIVYENEDYPTPLRQIALSPLILFYKGNLPSDEELKQSLAVVGSRDCEEYGQNIAHSAGKILSNNGWWNISGLAAGCDTEGHQGSLAAQGRTGAVLAHGLATDIYPPANKDLAAEIIHKDGFLLSELAPSASPAPHFFTWRDRLQSGLTKGIFIVETGTSGGTLHTANYALQQGKQVFVWEPTSPKLLPTDKIAGNLIFAGQKEATSDFKRKVSHKLTTIIPISCPLEFKDHFAQL